MDGAGQQHYLAGHDRLEALVHQLDADSPLVLDEDANDSLAGEKGHAARGQVRLCGKLRGSEPAGPIRPALDG